MRPGAVLRAALRDEWDGLERIWRDIRLPDLITGLNAAFGVLAMLAAAWGEPRLALELVLAAVVLDGLDGAVARRVGSGPLGGTLDALADTITFVAAPAFILSVSNAGPIVYAGAAVFLACGLLRLARFESLRAGPSRAYFSGLSTPAAALTLLEGWAVAPAAWAMALPFVLGVLMVSRVRFPKLRGVLGVIALLVILGVLALHGRAQQVGAIWTMLAFMLLYVLVGPFYVLMRMGPTEAP